VFNSPKNQNCLQCQQGFTLVELMIVLSLTAILMKLAVPAFQDVIRNNKVQTAANSLASAVGLARSEAVKRGTYVTICPTTNNTSCTASSTAWAGGWMVFIDTGVSTDPAANTPAVGTVLLAGTATKNLTISAFNTTTGTGTGVDFLRVSSRGALTAVRSFTVKPATCSTGFMFNLVEIPIGGRPSVSKSQC
jgi:type IV fimbrial biogenesis protein FimT